jgi:hypothetical protein
MGLSGLWLVMIKRTLGVESTAPLFGDEAVLLDQERLFNNVQTTNRSTCGGLYEDQPLCNAEIYASSVAMTQKDNGSLIWRH